jgi:hypothetical protein
VPGGARRFANLFQIGFQLFGFGRSLHFEKPPKLSPPPTRSNREPARRSPRPGIANLRNAHRRDPELLGYSSQRPTLPAQEPDFEDLIDGMLGVGV